MAILAPAAMGNVVGGAENLYEALRAALNQQPGLQCDLILIPSPESTLIDVLESYRRFARTNLDQYDSVISTKYPSWAVSHRCHIVYMLHKLRGLYDTYPAHLPSMPDPLEIAALGLDARITRALGGGSIDTLDIESTACQLLAALTLHGNPDHHAFPGPFARACLHLLDRIALAPEKIVRYAAISRTVATRHDYFPNGVAVQVLHPPTGLVPALTDPMPSPTARIFTASRLDSPKRVGLIIEAYAESAVPVPLFIAGTGPAEAELQALAKRLLPGRVTLSGAALPAPESSSAQIHFMGRISQEELASCYAHALFVPFIPYQEDYGLVTVEAMQAGRPVLSTFDAGGVTELIEDNLTGRIVAPTASALAQAMRTLCTDIPATKRMGLAAQSRAAQITWQTVVDGLLHGPADDSLPSVVRPVSRPAGNRRRRYIVINTFPILPVTHGGKVRLEGLYRQLSEAADIYFVNLAPSNVPHHLRQIAPGFVEELIPCTREFDLKSAHLERLLGVSAGDIAAALYPDSVPRWHEAIQRALTAAGGADAVICSHPYGYRALQMTGYTGPMLYESLNVEADLKGQMYGSQTWAAAAITQLERDCIAAARGVTVCSEDEKHRMIALYQIDPSQIAVIANGMRIAQDHAVRIEQRRIDQQVFRVRRPLAIYIASAHQPNVEGAHFVLQAARDCPEVDFFIIGSVCHKLGTVPPGANLRLLNIIGEEEKKRWLSIADLGLNPIVSGSGTNLKMIEYAVNGLPMISTRFGARGGIFTEGRDFIVTEPDDFAGAVRRALQHTDHLLQRMVDSAMENVRTHAEWTNVARQYAHFLSARTEPGERRHSPY